ncbi:hypothetical protein HBI42_105380 [Parastagonospora nodorum]|nr:hypothetical protein HBI43_103920 [Parastagonospora nodorum]KAH6258091.1 hypothetical protein HBI42_105380 [Parastagonospora nodorum]
MVQIVWADPVFAAHRLYESCIPDAFDNPFFSITRVWRPALSALVAFAYALYILAYPPKYKKLSIFTLSVPVCYAFCYSQDIAPSFTVCDTFTRFLYIWLAHVSLEVTILEWSPPVTKENPGTWKTRIASAYKVLFARENRRDVLNSKSKHGYSRAQFVGIHAMKAIGLYILQNAWYTFTWYYLIREPVHGADKAIFFRRLPESFNADELWASFDNVVHWCVVNMFLYEAYHSVFAVLFVGLGLDQPAEWSMSLFGHISEAYTVRRYWGKHWHNYIYASFNGHTQIVTRKWLRMRRGRTSTRLVENTMVFAMSGLMHSAVRFVQDPGASDYMVITLWYIGQMVPIVIEGIVVVYWQDLKEKFEVKENKWLTRFERTVGYVWVIGFNMWSITKYIHTRNEWAQVAMKRQYAEALEAWNITQANAMQGLQAVEGKVEL